MWHKCIFNWSTIEFEMRVVVFFYEANGRRFKKVISRMGQLFNWTRCPRGFTLLLRLFNRKRLLVQLKFIKPLPFMLCYYQIFNPPSHFFWFKNYYLNRKISFIFIISDLWGSWLWSGKKFLSKSKVKLCLKNVVYLEYLISSS